MTVGLLLRHLPVRGWEINPKFRGLLPLKGHDKISLLRWRISFCIWPSYNQKRGTTPSGSLWILEKTYSSERMTPAYLLSDPQSCWFGPKQEEALQQVHDDVQTALPHKPAGLMVLEVTVADKDTVWNLWQPLYVNPSTNPQDFGAKSCHSLWIIILLLRDWLATGS